MWTYSALRKTNAVPVQDAWPINAEYVSIAKYRCAKIIRQLFSPDIFKQMLKTKSNITVKNPSSSKLLVCRHKTLGLLFKPTHLTPTIEKKDVHPLGIDICTISDNLLPFQSQREMPCQSYLKEKKQKKCLEKELKKRT